MNYKPKIKKLNFTSKKKKSIDELCQKSQNLISFNCLEFSDLRALKRYLQNKNERTKIDENFTNDFAIKLNA